MHKKNKKKQLESNLSKVFSKLKNKKTAYAILIDVSILFLLVMSASLSGLFIKNTVDNLVAIQIFSKNAMTQLQNNNFSEITKLREDTLEVKDKLNSTLKTVFFKILGMICLFLVIATILKTKIWSLIRTQNYSKDLILKQILFKLPFYVTLVLCIFFGSIMWLSNFMVGIIIFDFFLAIYLGAIYSSTVESTGDFKKNLNIFLEMAFTHPIKITVPILISGFVSWVIFSATFMLAFLSKSIIVFITLLLLFLLSIHINRIYLSLLVEDLK